MTTLKGALDRVHRYLQQLPENVANVGAQSLYDPRFQSEEWPRPVYPITRADLEAILNQAVPYERPSRFSGAPEQWDAWLREVVADDKRLEFYQWIGRSAVRQAVGDVRQMFRDSPVPVEHRYFSANDVDELLDYIDPDVGATITDPYPTELPLGLTFCDVQHHTHTHGGSRLPTCRLDSPE